jgi:uncharacterized protein (TIGR02300 family)
MSKDLGTKHLCFKCATKFYDFKKPVPACPKCGADQRDKPAAAPRASKRIAPPTATHTELSEEGELKAVAEADEEPEDDAGDDAD